MDIPTLISIIIIAILLTITDIIIHRKTTPKIIPHQEIFEWTYNSLTSKPNEWNISYLYYYIMHDTTKIQLYTSLGKSKLKFIKPYIPNEEIPKYWQNKLWYAYEQSIINKTKTHT